MFLDDERKAVELDFLRSWERMEIFFSGEDMPWLNRMLPLVRAFRAQGYDRKLRAGQSMITLIVSRSREHGLRIDQPSVAFNLAGQGGISAHLRGEHVSRLVTVDRVEITPEIEELLIPLLAYPID